MKKYRTKLVFPPAAAKITFAGPPEREKQLKRALAIPACSDSLRTIGGVQSTIIPRTLMEKGVKSIATNQP